MNKMFIGKSGIYVVNTNDGNNNGNATTVDVSDNSASNAPRETVTSMYPYNFTYVLGVGSCQEIFS